MFLPLSLAVPPERLDGKAGDGDAEINEPFVGKIGLNLIRIVKQNPPFLQKPDMVFVAMLIERDEKIGLVAGRENLSGPDPDLEDRRPSRDRRGDGHVGHDFLVASAG